MIIILVIKEALFDVGSLAASCGVAVSQTEELSKKQGFVFIIKLLIPCITISAIKNNIWA